MLTPGTRGPRSALRSARTILHLDHELGHGMTLRRSRDSVPTGRVRWLGPPSVSQVGVPDDPRRCSPDRSPGREARGSSTFGTDVMPRTSPAPTWRARSPRGKTSGKRRAEQKVRRRSRADPLDPEKKFSRFGEGHRGEGIEIEHAARHRTAQVEEMRSSAGSPRSHGAPTRSNRQRSRCDGSEQPVKSAVHRRSRFEGDLLFHDQPDQRGEAGRPRPEPWLPCNSTTEASADPRRRAGRRLRGTWSRRGG